MVNQACMRKEQRSNVMPKSAVHVEGLGGEVVCERGVERGHESCDHEAKKRNG